MGDERGDGVVEREGGGGVEGGYMWKLYVGGLDRGLFEYEKGGGRRGRERVVGGEVGVVESEGFGVYEKLERVGGKLDVWWWGEVRGKFVEGEGNEGGRGRDGVGEIGGVYGVEEKMRMEDVEGEGVVKVGGEKW